MKALLFWTVCIPLRLQLATSPPPWMRAFAIVVGYRWLSGSIDNKVGLFGGEAWWADTRKLHGAMYTMYALTDRSEWLLADTAFGASSWILHSVQ